MIYKMILLLTPDPNGDGSGGSDVDTNTPESEDYSSAVNQTEETDALQTVDSAPLDESAPIGEALDQFNKMLNSGETAPSVREIVTRGLPASRKFDGLDENEKAWFTKMGNDAYNGLYPQFLEFKKLKTDFDSLKAENDKIKGAHIYDEPDAYMITPEFRQLQGAQDQLSAEASHWQEQLVKCKAGDDWIPIVLNQEGKPCLGAPRRGSPQDEALILGALTNAYTLQQNVSGRLEAFKTQFSERNKAFVSDLQAVTQKVFAGADMAKLAKAAESKLKIFPTHTHRQPMVQAFAQALVLIDGLTAMIRGQKKQASSRQINNRTALGAGPTDSEVSGSPGAQGRTVGDTLKQMQAMRAQGLA